MSRMLFLSPTWVEEVWIKYKYNEPLLGPYHLPGTVHVLGTRMFNPLSKLIRRDTIMTPISQMGTLRCRDVK